MTLEWNGAAQLAAMREQAAIRLLRAAIHLQTAHKKRLNVGNPSPHKNPAPRGDFPRKRTGFGLQGVMVVPTSISEVRQSMRIRIGHRQNAAYLTFLANKGWKGLLDTLEAERAALRQILGQTA